MKKTINKNDIIIIQKNVKELNEKDIIAINKNNKTIISRIYQIQGNENTQIVYVKGDNNLYPDNEIVKKENIEGKIMIKIPLIGGFVNFLQSKIMTVITMILLVFKFNVNKELKRRRKKLALSIDKEVKS